MQVSTIKGEQFWRVHAQGDEEYERIHNVLTSAIFLDAMDPHADLTQREAIRRALKLDALPAELQIEVDTDNSIEDMVLAGAYDIVPDITEGLFSVEGKGTGKHILRCELFQHPLKNFTPSEMVIAQMKERGLRPARAEELLSFGATYPLAQCRYRIVALGAVSNNSRFPHVLILDSHVYPIGTRRRFLSCGSYSGDGSREIGWRHTNSFLGVCEEKT